MVAAALVAAVPMQRRDVRVASIIETKSLTKRYGRLTAVQEVSLNVEEGSVFGFVGPNGAGKTTTMRILTTLLRPSGGEAWVGGCSVTKDPRGVRRQVGYMPDFFGVYNDMLVWEYLDFFAACYDVSPNKRPTLIDDLLALVDLNHRRDDPLNSLSRGMKQRLCLARTLAHDPAVLILDEPASGLDPRARIEIRELLREMKAMGKTIFFSSHILSEVEEICTAIGVIEAGQLVACGTLAELRALRPVRVLRIGLLDRLDEARALLVNLDGVQEVVDDPGPAWNGGLGLRVSFRGDDEAVSGLLAQAVAAGLPVISFTEETADLEDVFMQVTRGIVS
jgi:ABC-2 type transport system ATP-binding protein